MRYTLALALLLIGTAEAATLKRRILAQVQEKPDDVPNGKADEVLEGLLDKLPEEGKNGVENALENLKNGTSGCATCTPGCGFVSVTCPTVPSVSASVSPYTIVKDTSQPWNADNQANLDSEYAAAQSS